MGISIYMERDYVKNERFLTRKKQSQTKPILVPCKFISALTVRFRNFFMVLAAGKVILLFM